ncbi:hypothetical protein [Lysinibacillus pakistanensis]|uniref:hypothetical protein n=1 Tax=Lysinibacillus pakistanensis TaxID=759811 RepID=UPI003D2E97DD
MFNKYENFVDLQDIIEELEYEFIKLGFYTDALTKYYQIGKVNLERSDEILFSMFLDAIAICNKDLEKKLEEIRNTVGLR